MEVVVTHDVADFDALAASVGARLLYPRARIVLGPVGAGAREFLALHRDWLPTIPVAELDASIVRRVIVVDVRRARRLAFLPDLLRRIEARDPTLTVEVWDHHPASEDDIPADIAIVEPVGSATTLVVEALRARAIRVGPIEATLMAIGIHVDTGSLTFAATSGRDAVALAWLLDRGASLAVLNRYLHHPFGDAQREALRAALGAVAVEDVRGARVGFALLERGGGRLDEVASEALSLLDLHALFLVAPVEGKGAQVIARSRVAFVDVGQAIAAVGGGGHAAAAAATVRGRTPEQVRADVLVALAGAPSRPLLVRDLMSSPVRTVGTKTRMSDVKEALVSGRHSGLPVVKDGAPVGIVSARDVARAEKRGELDRPVRRFMSSPARTVRDDALADDALAVMERHDVGRLPVLRDGRLVGIVTRSDLIRMLYDEGLARPRGAP